MSAPRNAVLRGDCVEVMRTLPSDSIDAIVTDPPYELGFMGKSWDSTGVSYDPATWAEALRVLRPGGHLLAFGGSRTYHRMAVAIEDAGFEIRDSLMWIYGSGFPKSHNLKGEWEGWGTALKPGHEPIVLARKPLIGTVAANVLTHGTGALNIDASRIAAPGESFDGLRGRPVAKLSTRRNDETDEEYDARVLNSPGQQAALAKLKELGRWPANILFDEEAAAVLDEQSGNRPGGSFPKQRGKGVATAFGEGRPTPGGARQMNDSGGASRFFYVAKAGKKERNAGVALNNHPTVKPIALMGYLIKMVTPPGGVVLDPFLGSGSTACAAAVNGFDWLGIEREEGYADIAKARIAHWAKEAR
jgi:hypothetical protein